MNFDKDPNRFITFYRTIDTEPMEPGDAEALAEASREYANGECQTLAEVIAELSESTTEMPPNPGVTPEDPRQSTMRGEQ